MKKILIIHTAFIGDIVLSTPLIQRLKDMYPSASIDYLTLPVNKSIISNNPNLDEVLLYDKKGNDKGIKGFLRVLKEIKSRKYDYAVIPHRFIRSIALAKFAGIKNIVGFDVATGSWLLDKKVHYDMKKHEVERLLDLVDYKGEKIPVRIYPSKTEKKKIDSILVNTNYNENDNNKKLIVISPSSQRLEKIWPFKKYREVISKLVQNKNYFVIIAGGVADKELPFDLSYFENVENKDNIIDLRGKVSLLEFAELLGRADITLSNDSGPLHIACGFEKPFVIGIFGPGKRSLGFFPWKDKSIVIEDNDFYENNMENIPPLDKQHKYTKEYYKKIPEISVDRVYKEIINRI